MIGTTNAKFYIQPYIPCSWSSGTDEQIVEALQKHYAGETDLHRFWHVGDTRSITLSAMGTTYVGESQPSQTVEMVLMDTTCTGFTLTNENVTPAFIVGQKDCLNETGYMNSTTTNIGGWRDCARRTWCNYAYREAFPSTIKSIFKQFTWQQGAGGTSTTSLISTQDYFGIAPEKCIFGTRTWSPTVEADLYSGWEYYQTASNRIKTTNGTVARWWECSPINQTDYCAVYTDGTADNGAGATSNFGISPFGCI